MHREMRFQAVTTSATESVLGEWGEVRPTLLNTSMVSRSLLEFVRVHPCQRQAVPAVLPARRTCQLRLRRNLLGLCQRDRIEHQSVTVSGRRRHRQRGAVLFRGW